MNGHTSPIVLLAALMTLGGCSTSDRPAPAPATSASDRPPEGPLDWTLGTWVGVRRDGSDGSEEPMTMRVEPILDGAGQIRHIEVRHAGGTYRGFAVQAFDSALDRWVRQYVNAVRGRFARLEGEVGSGSSVWRSTSPQRTRDSRLVSERLASGDWRRTMSISEDDGKTWRVLWTDELRRADEW